MRKIAFIIVSAVLALTFDHCNSIEGNAATNKITFYDVPLICGAYNDIGCGSRAKPALMDMEKNPGIKEAWLNREGTVIAVVWNGSEQTAAIVKPILDSHQIEYTILKGDEVKENEKTFRQRGLWYRGAEVDQLSIEEAKHIAGTLSAFALERKLITQQESDILRPRVEEYFKTELIKIRTREQLNIDSRTKFTADLITMSESVLGQERTRNILMQWNEYRMEEYKKNASCTDKSKDACCKKK